MVSPSDLIAGETRIQDADGFVGTVAYVGPVASSKNPTEVYAGIVWDDASRGKHDGSVICRQTNKIVRHFSCGPSQGSFLRLKKLDLGVPLTASLLRSKYVEMNAPIIAPNNLLPHTLVTSTGKEKTIEFFGELQIREKQQLEDIQRISLRREGISKASDNATELKDFQQIEELDLAGNLLCNWVQVLKIVQQLPNLENFSVAHNHIRDVTPKLELSDPCFGIKFDQMKVLNLNNCCIDSFGTVMWLAKSMPSLESLCVAHSNLSDIEHFEVTGFGNLQRLDCSDCKLTQWEEQIDKFAKLPKLESLCLDDNPISSIPQNAGQALTFPSLVSLQLSGTMIEHWIDLEGINYFSSLKSLRLKNLPLTKNLGEGDVRSTCLARFPDLEYLNASSISRTERTEAERRYVALVTHMIQRCKMEGNAATTTEDSILNEHPRYVDLREKHKNLVIFNNGGEKGESLASSIYNITIRSLAPSSCTMEPVTKRLPSTLNVERLKALCSRIFGLDYDLISLRFRSDAQDSLPVEMEDDDKTLDYYGLCDGAEILMNEIDISARSVNLRKKQEDHDQRIAEQNRTITAMKELRSRK
jgi:Leucine-rich repeat (LRR) protein